MNFKITSINDLTTFLKRFSPISNSLLLEIDGEHLKAKTHTPERSVVKSSKIELSQIFSFSESIDEPILIGIYSLDKLIKAFSHFSGDDVNMAIQTETTEDGVVGTEIVLQNSQLTINFQCASLRLFTHVTDEMMNKIADVETAEVNFVLTKDIQTKIASLGSIDSDQKILSFNLKKGVLSARGKSYDYTLCNVDNKKVELEISVYKNQFNFLDREDVVTYMSEDRLICQSIETSTSIVIGKVD
jgi:hypothetical protein